MDYAELVASMQVRLPQDATRALQAFAERDAERSDDRVIETYLDRSLDGFSAASAEEAAKYVLETVGGAATAMRLLCAELAGDGWSDDPSLVPDEYLPIGHHSKGAAFYFVGCRGERAGALFVVQLAGQDPVLTQHDRFERVGQLGEL